MCQSIYLLDVGFSFRRIIFKTESGKVLISKRAIPLLLPFLYLILAALNFRIRFLEINLSKIYLSRVFLHELKKEFHLSPLRFILRLFFVSFIYSSKCINDRVNLSDSYQRSISVAEQAMFSYFPFVRHFNATCPNQKRLLFAFQIRRSKAIFPSMNYLIRNKIVNKVGKIFEPRKSLTFSIFNDVTMIDGRTFLNQCEEVITTAPFELANYSGLPIRGVVRFGHSDLLMMNTSPTDYHEKFSNHVIFFGYSHQPSNYYHFIIEILPRILIYKKHSPQKNVGLVIGDTPNQILEIYTKALGNPPILLKEPFGTIKFDRITLARDFRHQKLVDFTDAASGKNIFSSRCSELMSSKLFLETTFGEMANLRNKQGNLKAVFLTRKIDSERAPINLIELEQLMLANGVTTVDTSDLPIGEQIALFREAQLVLALSGASLTNLMFCKKDTFILLIAPDMTPFSFVFWRDYAEIFGLTLITLHSVYEKINNRREYRVNLNKLNKIIQDYVELK